MERLISLDVKALEAFSNSPEEILKEDIALQIAVASHPNTSRNILEVLANSEIPEVAEAAQMHVNYAGELTEAWQDTVENKLKSRYLGQNDRLAVELLKIAPLPVYFLSEYVPPEYLIQGLKNSYLSKRDRAKLLARLAKEPTLEPRLQVAESHDTPPEVLEQLIGDLELSIRIAVEYSPNCPPELVELVKGQHQVASNWDTDSQQLENLSNSNWDWIRLAVAQNPSASEETLFKLAGDKVFKIQLSVAQTPVTSPKVLAVLAEHSSKAIQAEIAKHPHATEEILHSLFNTQHNVIKSRDNLPVSILEKFFNESPKEPQKPLFLVEYGGFLSFFTKQLNTPTWILAEFANIDLEELRTYAERQYPKSPIKNNIEGWISDRSSGLIELTKHPRVSTESLQQLANFPNQRVQLAVAQNSQAPQALKKQLLNQLLVDSKDYIKVKIASNPKTPKEILEKSSEILSSNNVLFSILREIAPNITSNLLNKIKEFIDRHKAPELVLFWLQQGKEFQASILDDWNTLLTSLTDEKSRTLEQIVNQQPKEKLQGKFTVKRKALSRSSNQLKPQTLLLKRLMYLLNNYYNSDVTNQLIVAALLCNSSTPKNLREQLWQQHQKKPDDMGRYRLDSMLRIALAYNIAIPEAKRTKYFEQLLESGNNLLLAENPLTPKFILEQLAENNHTKYKVAENPNSSADLLRKLATEDNEELLRRIAINPSTPTNLLTRRTERGRKK